MLRPRRTAETLALLVLVGLGCEGRAKIATVPTAGVAIVPRAAASASAKPTPPALALALEEAPDASMIPPPANVPTRPPAFRVMAMPRGNNRIEGVYRAPDGQFHLAIQAGYAFDDAVLTLHPVVAAGIGPAVAKHGSFGYAGMAGVSIERGGGPWIATHGDERDVFRSTFRAWRMDDASARIRFAPADEGRTGRIRWQSFEPPRAIASYEEVDTVPLSDAQLAQLRKNQEEAEQHGFAIDYAGTRTTERRLLVGVLGGSESTHLLAKMTDRSFEANRPTLATSPREAAVLYWTERPLGGGTYRYTMETRWFDWSGQQTKEASLEATGGTTPDHSPIAIAADGTLYAALSAPSSPPGLPAVQSFDAAGHPGKRVDLPLHGFIYASALAAVRCSGSVWIVAQESAGHTVTVKAFRMQDGALASTVTLGSHRFHEAQATATSVNANIMHAGCGGERMAVAFQVRDQVKDLDATVAVYAEWDAR